MEEGQELGENVEEPRQPFLPKPFHGLIAADQEVPVDGDGDRDDAVDVDVEPADQENEVTKLGHAPDFPSHISY